MNTKHEIRQRSQTDVREVQGAFSAHGPGIVQRGIVIQAIESLESVEVGRNLTALVAVETADDQLRTAYFQKI